MKQIIITNDTFDIAKRLNEIDENYILKYNKEKKRYEVHYKTSCADRLELVVPYKELDIRTIHYVNKTRVENHQILLKQMEENNKKLEENAKKTVLDEAQIKAKEIANYVFKKGEHTNYEHDKSYKTKWV